VHGIEQLLQAPDRAAAMGSAGRQRVTRDYAWEAHLAVLSRHLAALRPGAPGLAVQPIFNQEPAA
jgi:glycosyltransferase involved in cell wall biosynthesis